METPKLEQLDTEDICPPWWPQFIWDAHFHVPSRVWPPGHGPGPVNRPPEVNNILALLTIHTFTYQLADAKEASRIREISKQQIIASAGRLS